MIIKRMFWLPALFVAGALIFACNTNDPGEKEQENKNEQGTEDDSTPKPGTYTFVMPDYTVKASNTSYGKTTWAPGDKIYIHGNYNPSSVTITLEQSNISSDGKTATVNLEKVPSTGASPDILYAAYPA